VSLKAEEIDAAQVREVLTNLGLTRMEGSNNPGSEFWLTSDGYPYIIPYFVKGNPNSFLRCAWDDVLDKLT
jgi:hypothetical protein